MEVIGQPLINEFEETLKDTKQLSFLTDFAKERCCLETLRFLKAVDLYKSEVKRLSTCVISQTKTRKERVLIFSNDYCREIFSQFIQKDAEDWVNLTSKVHFLPFFSFHSFVLIFVWLPFSSFLYFCSVLSFFSSSFSSLFSSFSSQLLVFSLFLMSFFRNFTQFKKIFREEYIIPECLMKRESPLRLYLF